MTWPESREKIAEYVESLGYVVHPVPPDSIDNDKINVILTPPARDPDRYPGGQIDTDYHQRLMALRRLGDRNGKAVANAVDDAAEAITDKFHEHIVLEGAATATEPVSWQEAYVDKYPPTGSQDFLIAVGLLDVNIVKQVTVGA